MEEGFVEARSDNLPQVDAFALMRFAATNKNYISAEIRNEKSDRSMRDDYTNAAIERIRLKREGTSCLLKAQVCPEHKQHASNYHVSMMVNEEDDGDSIIDPKCHNCAASEGGCKHALAFLMWVFKKSSQPAPTKVECYWAKPKLTRISANQVLRATDFGSVNRDTRTDDQVQKLSVLASLPSAPVSALKRYNTPIDDISLLDLHIMCGRYVASKGRHGPFTPAEFREFCRLSMSEDVCKTAFEVTEDQATSRQWNLCCLSL